MKKNADQYGDYLAQLISLEDDTEDETVGTKDGEVAAQVWLEKDYKANAAQLSSNQYILFIGQDKLIKEKKLPYEYGVCGIWNEIWLAWKAGCAFC